MQKFLFDKEIVNNQLSVLNNTLASQRQTKKTLLSYLEKFSDAMYENFNSDNTDSLLSLINEAHSIFECIKSNIYKTIELKTFLENIYNSDFLNTIDTEKFNKEFNELLDNISKTNSSYLTFMNNYEAFIKPVSIDKNEEIENIILEDSASSEEIEIDYLNQDEEESLFETVNNSNTITEDITTEISTQKNSNENNSALDLEENIQETIQENLAETPNENISNEETLETVEIQKTITIIDEPEEEHFEETTTQIDLPEKELIINKKLGIAILPYSIPDLDELFLNDPEKYSSIQDIIDQEYTVKLKDFENSSITRYKEAFKLAKDKSNYTFSQAANFAKIFLIENEITSLIIASCKNVEELEFYIECLNNNKLNDFHCFKIVEK